MNSKSRPVHSTARRLLAAALFLCPLAAMSTTAPVMADELLRGDAIRALVSGGRFQTVTGKGLPFALEFHPDGRLSGEVETPMTIKRDEGRWWMAASGALCFKFENFAQGKKRCHLLKRNGNNIAHFRPNGEDLPVTWTAERFGPGAATAVARARPKPAPKPMVAPAPAAPKDTEGPAVAVPATLATETATVTLAGKVRDSSQIVEVTVNQRPVSVSPDGSFAVTRGVPQGSSTLTIAALDEWGNRTSKTVTVTRKAPPVRQAKLRGAEPNLAPPAPPKPAVNPFADIHFGSYHALVIGNNDYRKIQHLRTAEGDARAVADVLKRDYGFRVKLLTNATRADVIGGLAEMRARLKPDDSLLVFFAGHGVLDDVAQQGYWLPVDAEEGNPTNWISTNDITTMLRVIRAKHIMVVADSCYSGTLVRAVSGHIKTAQAQTEWVRRMAAKRARTALVSGGLEPVEDGSGTHSVFAKAFIDALAGNRGVLAGEALFNAIKRPVVLNADQTPQYSDIRRAGHEGGDFLFVRKNR